MPDDRFEPFYLTAPGMIMSYGDQAWDMARRKLIEALEDNQPERARMLARTIRELSRKGYEKKLQKALEWEKGGS